MVKGGVAGNAGGKKRRKGGGCGGDGWTGADHAMHNEERRRKRLKKQLKKERQREEVEFATVTRPATEAETETTTPTNRIDAAGKDIRRLQRQVISTRESAERKEDLRLQLHLSKTKRQLAVLKELLENWDPEVSRYEPEATTAYGENEEEKLISNSNKNDKNNTEEGQGKIKTLPKRKVYQGKGPETWKLKGAARPAWQVYDFDTRYVDPSIQAHELASAKTKRSHNILGVYKGRLGALASGSQNKNNDKDNNMMRMMSSGLAAAAREYLCLLMQFGHLSREAQNFASARKSWLECLELEGDDPKDDKDEKGAHQQENHQETKTSTGILAGPPLPSQAASTVNPAYTTITTARECLMRLYLQCHKYDSAWRLGAVRLHKDTSVWIRYSTAWVALVEKEKVLTQNHSSSSSSSTPSNNSEALERHLVKAIRSNVFCAYYLAFYDIFKDVMEYTDDIVHRLENGSNNTNDDDADDEPQSSLEEAIEYCCSSIGGGDDCTQAIRWQGSPQRALQALIVQGLQSNHEELSVADLAWEDRLGSIERDYASRLALANNSRRRTTNTTTTRDEKSEETRDLAGNTNNSRRDRGGKEIQGEQQEERQNGTCEEDNDDDYVDGIEDSSENRLVDVSMYAGMFRTAMDMVKEGGLLQSLMPLSSS